MHRPTASWRNLKFKTSSLVNKYVFNAYKSLYGYWIKFTVKEKFKHTPTVIIYEQSDYMPVAK